MRLAGVGFVLAAAALALGGVPSAAAGGKKESQVKVTATAAKIDKDGRQAITIKMHINDGWHAYANPVKNEDLESVQTVVKIVGSKNLDKVDIAYPAGKRHMTGTESYHVYEGDVEIIATVKRAAGDTGPLEVTVKYQTCHDKKMLCLPPESVKLEVK
jgi:DsbC/DsbD-like thiol-disulfide interchange protein